MTLASQPSADVQSDLLIIPVFSDDDFTDEATLDAASGGEVKRARSRGELTGKPYEVVVTSTTFSNWKAARALLVAGEGPRRDRAAHDLFPEAPARSGAGNHGPHRIPEACQQTGERAEPGRENGFDPPAEPPGENGRCASRADTDHDVLAIDDRGHDEVAKLGAVHDVGRHVFEPRQHGGGAVAVGIAGKVSVG